MRETKIIKIGAHSFTIKTYATAREANTIQQAYFAGTKVELVGENPQIKDFNPGVQFEVEQEIIKQMVINMDESTDDILNRVLDLPADEFNELVVTLDTLIAKKKS